MNANTNKAVADMGHGQMVTLTPKSATKWELTFSKDGVTDYAAPPAGEIQVEAIDAKGMVHPLLVVAGPSKSIVSASGRIEGALRARIIVDHGDHAHTREVALPGAAEIPRASGPEGSTLVDMGHDNHVAVTTVGQGRIQFRFLAQKAPPTNEVVVEAIYRQPTDNQVRRLTVETGGNDTTLIASGNTTDCSHIRLAVIHGDHFHTRTVPMAL